jgi:hypothetical protein
MTRWKEVALGFVCWIVLVAATWIAVYYYIGNLLTNHR